MDHDTDMTVRQSYEEWHSRYSVDEGAEAPWHGMIKAHLRTEDIAGRRVLEIGCGRGGFSCWLAGHANPPCQIIATDFSITAVQKAGRYAHAAGLSRVRWAVGDIQAIAHPDATFDTVISSETIEHVPSPSSALAELSRVLKPGGRLLLTTPNYLGIMGAYRLYCGLRGRVFTEEGQPINNFLLLPTTRAWVSRAGLRVVLAKSVGHYLPFPGRSPLRMPIFDRAGILTRWLGLHSLIIGEKPLV
jgi:2-polyprenyl-3-methyl-5-hydroxy-6-metoxy-1,4-benzoquinol methylase